MNLERMYMIFKDEYGKYQIGLNKKNINGEWEKAYFPVKFKKDVELEDKTKIYIKDYWFDFYNWEHDGKKGTKFYFFINDFSTVEDKSEELKKDTNVKSIEFSDEDLKRFENDDLESQLPF